MTAIYVPRIPRVRAQQFVPAMGWRFVSDLAEHYSGVAIRDENPEDRDKTYYWSIQDIPSGDGNRSRTAAYPGDWIIRELNTGEVSIMSDIEFARMYQLED